MEEASTYTRRTRRSRAGQNWISAAWIAACFAGVLVILVSGTLVLSAMDGGRLCLNCLFMTGHHHHHAERPASTSLKTIAAAQADYRANDRDGNGVHDFWREDIAGLYTIVHAADRDPEAEFQNPIKLIELSVAGADDRPVTDIETYTVRSPKGGYHFRALRCLGETDPDPNRFAAVAFPAVYSKETRWTFIINEYNTVYKGDLGHGMGIEFFPTEEELRRNWAKLD